MNKKGVVYSTDTLAGVKDRQCLLFGISIKAVTKESCISQSSIIAKNKAYCCEANCSSRYRVCLICLGQGVSKDDNDGHNKVYYSTDSKTGNCSFHVKHGPSVNPKGNGDGRALRGKNIFGKKIIEETEEYIAKYSGKKSGPSPQVVNHSSKAALTRTVSISESNIEIPTIKKGRKSEEDKEKEEKILQFIKKSIMKSRSGQKMVNILVDDIRPLKGQPRLLFKEGSLRNLANCMSELGTTIEIRVRPLKDNPQFKYELIDGERRWRAAKKAGLKKIPAIVSAVNDRSVQLLISFMANLNREGHTDLERASAIKQARENFGLSSVKIAQILGQPLTWVYRNLQLTKLDKKVQDLMDYSLPNKKRLKFSVALHLAGLPTDLQMNLANEIIRRGMVTNRAIPFIRMKANEKGFRTGYKRRTPREDYKNFNRIFSRARNGAEIFMEMSSDDFQKMFESRNSNERQAVRLAIDACIKDFGLLKNKI